ncbi:MAG: caspase family protein [Oscillatoria princeps RMCB-10]|jgi:hypothetical protein|nr:caspase family protein [Oscillatoria princeps RMCB-10]
MNKRLALVVGINEYAYLDNLSTAAKDAEAVAKLLMRWGNFDVIRLRGTLLKGQVSAEDLGKARLTHILQHSQQGVRNWVSQPKIKGFTPFFSQETRFLN